MTVYLKDNTENKLKNNSIHYVPCKIHYDGEAKINQYFTYDKAGDDDKECELKASFRGYPLSGKEIAVPEGYKGRIFKENTSSYFDNTPRHLKATQAFDSMVFWNWDQPPSRADPFISALDWIHVAKALHEDPEED